MVPRARMWPLSVAVALSVGLLAGCTKGGSTAAPTPSATGSSSGSGSATSTATPTPSAAPLPASCGELLPLLDLDQALGFPLVGRTAYIEGVAEPKINRLGRVTCRYGLQTLPGNKTSPPRMELGVSVYTDAESATKRVDATVLDARSRGAAPKQVQVGGHPGTVLLGAGFQELVVAADTRTLALSFAGGLIRGDPSPRLLAVAELALKNLPQ
jgi:hypothetical protein